MAGFGITFKGRRYRVEQKPRLAIPPMTAPWCISVDRVWYQLTSDAADAQHVAIDFAIYSLRNSLDRAVMLVASRRYPLLTSINGIAVRAWPAVLPRGKGARTFLHPTLNRRVATDDKGPMWMFESAGRSASPFGSATVEQSIADVRDLATLWLRSDDASDEPG